MEFDSPNTTEYSLTYRPEFHDFFLQITDSSLNNGKFVNIRDDIVTMANTPLFVKIARFPNGFIKIYSGNKCFEGHKNVILALCKNKPSQFFIFEGGCIFCDGNNNSSFQEIIRISYSSTSTSNFSIVSQQDIKREVIMNSESLLRIQRDVNFDLSSNLNLSSEKAFNLSVDKSFDVNGDKSFDAAFNKASSKSMDVYNKMYGNKYTNKDSIYNKYDNRDSAFDISSNKDTSLDMSASKDTSFDMSARKDGSLDTNSRYDKYSKNRFGDSLNSLTDIDLNAVLSSPSWHAYDMAMKKSHESAMAANAKKSIDASANKINAEDLKEKMNLKKTLNLNSLSDLTNLKDLNKNLEELISSNIKNEAVTQHHADLNNSLSDNLDVLNTSLNDNKSTSQKENSDAKKSLESTQAINDINLNNSLSGILNNLDSRVSENLNMINTNLLSAILNSNNDHIKTISDLKNTLGENFNELLSMAGYKDLSTVLNKVDKENLEKRAINKLTEIMTSKNKQDINNSLSEAVNTSNVNKVLENIKNNKNQETTESIINDLHNYTSSNKDVKESINNLKESLTNIINNQDKKQESESKTSKKNESLLNALKQSTSSETFRKVLDSFKNSKELFKRLQTFIANSGANKASQDKIIEQTPEEMKSVNNKSSVIEKSREEKKNVDNKSSITKENPEEMKNIYYKSSVTKENPEEIKNFNNKSSVTNIKTNVSEPASAAPQEVSKNIDESIESGSKSNSLQVGQDFCVGNTCFKINESGEVIEKSKIPQEIDQPDVENTVKSNEVSQIVEKKKNFGIRDALKLIPEETNNEIKYEKLENPVTIQQETRENENNEDLFKGINLEEINTIKPKKVKIQNIKILPATHYSVQKVKVLPKKTIKVQDVNVKKKRFNVMNLKLMPKKKIEIQDVVTYRKPIIEKLPDKKVMITDVTECPEKKVQPLETKKMEDKELEVVDVKNIPAKKIEITEIKKLPKKVIELKNNFEYEDNPITDEEIKKAVVNKVSNIPINPAMFTKNVVVEGDKQKSKFTVNSNNEVKIDVKDK
ncbi:hypothetical protein DMUE_2420 [Dictyocoela muelleri]|nr:hypothetical protein DMUE_2420 [Dictyocoela muelleri]